MLHVRTRRSNSTSFAVLCSFALVASMALPIMEATPSYANENENDQLEATEDTSREAFNGEMKRRLRKASMLRFLPRPRSRQKHWQTLRCQATRFWEAWAISAT